MERQKSCPYIVIFICIQNRRSDLRKETIVSFLEFNSTRALSFDGHGHAVFVAFAPSTLLPAYQMSARLN